MPVALARLSATAEAPRAWSPVPCREAERVRSVAVCQGNSVLHVEQGHSPEQEEAAGVQRTPCVPARGVL